MNAPADILSRLKALRDSIASHALRAGRRPEDVRLIAVSKTFPPTAIEAACEGGQRLFGENYAQEFREKLAVLGKLPIEWHFVGSLQTNKVKYVVGKASLIHSVDRPDVAHAVARRATKAGIAQKVLIEVRPSGKEIGSGCDEAGLKEIVALAGGLKGLELVGLMTVGPLTEDRSLVAKEFARLRRLRDNLTREKLFPGALAELSMGMSGDYDLAIAEGATLIRVGTRIFGARKTS